MRESNLKPSNHNYIGNIPNEWGIKKLKYVVQKLKSGGTPDSSNPDYYTDEDSGIKWLSIGDMSTNNFVYDTKNHITNNGVLVKNLNIFPAGTILYSIYATIGKVSELGTEAAINQAILAITPKKEMNKDFLKFSLKSLEDYAISLASESTQKNLNANKVENFPIVFPQLREQVLIASFLDHKCFNINSIINDLEKQIEILERYKKSVITKAVTKGLNPDVELKDSGVKWIGEVPIYWEITRFQDIAFFKKGPFGSALTINMFVDKAEDTIKVYEQKNAIGKDYTLGEYYITKSYFGAMRNFEVFPGDVIVSCAGTIGECYIMPESMDKGIINQALMRVKFKESVSKKYFLYIFDFLISEQSATDSNGSAMKNIPPLNILKKYKVPLPSMEEQNRISDFLDKRCYEIDSIIEDKKNQLETIRKYKNSLIYEYVTGKKRVSQGDVNE